jgi:hypothetical protein
MSSELETVRRVPPDEGIAGYFSQIAGEESCYKCIVIAHTFSVTRIGDALFSLCSRGRRLVFDSNTYNNEDQLRSYTILAEGVKALKDKSKVALQFTYLND